MTGADIVTLAYSGVVFASCIAFIAVCFMARLLLPAVICGSTAFFMICLAVGVITR